MGMTKVERFLITILIDIQKGIIFSIEVMK